VEERGIVMRPQDRHIGNVFHGIGFSSLAGDKSRRLDFSSLWQGKVTRARVPLPGSESKVSRPPCKRTREEVIARPSPVPPLSCLVVKKGSHKRARCSGGMPTPSS